METTLLWTRVPREEPRQLVLRGEVRRGLSEKRGHRSMTEHRHDEQEHDLPQRRPRGLGRAWAGLPLRAKGLIVVAIPVAALVVATLLFGVALGEDRQAQGLVLRTVEVERQLAQVRVLFQTGVGGYLLTGEEPYLDAYKAASRDLPNSLARLRALVSDNPTQVANLQRVTDLASRRHAILTALIASVRAEQPPRSRAALLDRSKQTSDALIGQLNAMQTGQQRLLAGRQARARRTRTLALEAIGLSVLLGLGGGVIAMLLFTSGVTRRVRQLEGNAGRLAEGRPLPPTQLDATTRSAASATAWRAPASCWANGSTPFARRS